MINNILLNKNLPFPHISFSLLLSCLIISLPILLNDVLYAFLGANVGLAFPWQYLTSVFTHGPQPPLIIHLLINLAIIVFCVTITEKLLGIWRTFVIIVFVATILTFIRFETLNFYNGISSFLYAFAPFLLFIVLKEYKNNREIYWNKFYHILSLFTLLIVFVLYPLYFTLTESFFCERNILQFISAFIGIIFLLIWRKKIYSTLTETTQNKLRLNKLNIWDKISRTIGYLVTTINFLVLLVVLIFFD